MHRIKESIKAEDKRMMTETSHKGRDKERRMEDKEKGEKEESKTYVRQGSTEAVKKKGKRK